MIKNAANGKYPMTNVILLYGIYGFALFLLSYILFCWVSEDTTIAINWVSGYLAVVGLFILTPIFIMKYLSTQNYENKNTEYFWSLAIFSLSGLAGIILFLAHIKIIEEFIYSPAWITLAVFIPTIPFAVCIYLRNRK